MVLQLNTLSEIKFNGMENTEKLGFSNLNYLIVSLKRTMLIKEQLDIELGQTSKTIKPLVSELTHFSEITHH